jgi:tetratricopeptide (TPR) repeat protein
MPRAILLPSAAALILLSVAAARAQDDPAVMRDVSAPGRISGQAAEEYRKAQAAQAAQPVPVAVSTIAVVPPAPAPRQQIPVLWAVTAALLALAGLAAAWAVKKRKAEAARLAAEAARLKAAAPPPPKPDDEAALLAGAADASKRDTVADYILRARRMPEFLARCHGRPEQFLSAYAQSFLRLGAWETAVALLSAKKVQDPGEQVLSQALQAVIAGRGGRPAAEVYAETLLLAAELSRRGSHAQALSLLSPGLIQKMEDAAAECLVVAGLYHAAGKTADFLAQAQARKRPQFYRSYAEAFRAVHEPGTALALIQMKRPKDAGDYALFVACHKELGRVAQMDLASVLDPDRLALAQALMDAGEDAAGLKALLEKRLEALSRADQALALRICRRLKDISTAGKLFQHIKLTVGLADAPELYQLYALVCEEVGQRRDARDIYDEILRRFPGDPEASAGLRRL